MRLPDWVPKPVDQPVVIEEEDWGRLYPLQPSLPPSTILPPEQHDMAFAVIGATLMGSGQHIHWAPQDPDVRGRIKMSNWSTVEFADQAVREGLVKNIYIFGNSVRIDSDRQRTDRPERIDRFKQCLGELAMRRAGRRQYAYRPGTFVRPRMWIEDDD